jgi:DnaA family protein
MKQLVLDLGAHAQPRILRGRTECRSGGADEAIRRRTSREHFAYLWGAVGVGKSHLLKALASAGSEEQLRALYFAVLDRIEFVYSPEVDLYLLDDCEKLSPLAQIDAFALFNEIRANNAFMVCSGAWRRPCCRCAKTCARAWAGA